MSRLLIYSISERGVEMNQRKSNEVTNRKIIPLQQRQETSQGMAQRQESAQSSSRNFKRLRPSIIGLIGFFAVAIAGFPMIQTLTHSKEIAENYATTQAMHEQAIQQNRAVQQEYQKMQDPEYLAEIARRDYFYSKPGEIIFDLGGDGNHTEADLFQNASPHEEVENESAEE